MAHIKQLRRYLGKPVYIQKDPSEPQSLHATTLKTMIQEIELKYRFKDLASYLLVLNNLGRPAWVEKQTNHFFDTSSLALRSKRIYLRLRQSNQDFYLTCKAKPELMTKSSEQIAVHDEWEQALSVEEASALLTGKTSTLSILQKSWPNESPDSKETRLSLLSRVQNACANQPLALIGSFKNQRTHVPYSWNRQVFDLEFDQTDFGNGQLDYELEIELPAQFSSAPLESKISELLVQLGIETLKPKGKSERFFGIHLNPPPH